MLRKWKSSEPAVLAQIPSELLDSESTQLLATDHFVKVLGVEWNATSDTFRPVVSSLKSIETLTKRALLSDIARLFDVLGWCSPAIIKPKILLQQVWRDKSDWDDPVPKPILTVWQRWRKELPVLQERHIQRSYFPKDFNVASIELHGFSDASESAYAGVIYIRATDSLSSHVHTALVMAKTKVAPIKRLSVPRLELCGALLITKLLIHCGKILNIPLSSTFAWTDSTVVLSWLRGDPSRFKPFVGNRVAEIMNELSPNQWHHVPGSLNPADCASRGLYPAELATHITWWEGPNWLRLPSQDWPSSPEFIDTPLPEEEKPSPQETTLCTLTDLSLLERTSSYSRLRRVTA